MGIGCEYVLKPVADFLRYQGCECLEADLMRVNYTLADWRALAKHDVIFITSAHLEKGKERAEQVSKLASKFMPSLIAPLELLDILKPIKSVYIPHDLTMPLGLYEWKFIDQFDLFFNPLPFFPIYANLIQTKEIGWIKYFPTIQTLPLDFSSQKKIIFVSLFDYLQDSYGLEGLFEYLKPLLDEKTAIKFPLWGNHKEVEAYFRKHSCVKVCEAHWNSVELMSYFDVIIGNHVSSVLMEAAFLNKKVLCLESDLATPCHNYQRHFLGYLPNLKFFPYFNPQTIPPDFFKNMPFKPLSLEERLKPFDFEQAFKLITA